MIYAVGKRIVARKVDFDPQPISRILVAKKEEFEFMFVMARGSEADESITPDSIIVVAPNSSYPFKVKGVEYFSIVEASILAVFKEES